MAEGLFRALIADRSDLTVRSAGVSAYPGQPVSAHAVEALQEVGIDIAAHRSTPLGDDLVREAACLIAMTRSHLDSILYIYPEAAEKTFLLREFEEGATNLDVAQHHVFKSDPARVARGASLHRQRCLRGDP